MIKILTKISASLHLPISVLFRKSVHFDKFRSPKRTLRRSVDAPRATDSPRQAIALLSARPDISAVCVSLYWSTVGSRRGTCRRNAWTQNKSRRPPNSRIGICIPSSRFRVLDTSANETRENQLICQICEKMLSLWTFALATSLHPPQTNSIGSNLSPISASHLASPP